MLYAFSLKRKTNIGKLLYRYSGAAAYILLLLFILILSVTGVLLYSLFTDTGYTSFSNEMQYGKSAKLELHGGTFFSILTVSDADKSFCLYLTENMSAVILVNNSDLTSKYTQLIEYTKNAAAPPLPISVTGLTRTFSTDFNKIAKSDPLLSALSHSFGDVFLDTTIAVYPSLFKISLYTLAVLLTVFALTYAFASIKDIGIHKTLLSLENNMDDFLRLLEGQCQSPYNIAIGKFMVLSDDFCMNIKKHEIIFLDDISKLYIRTRHFFGKNLKKTLLANTMDGKTHVLISAFCRHNKKSAVDHAAEILSEKICISNTAEA